MKHLDEELFDHICRKAGGGIPYPEAVQLMLWSYCVKDILPRQFRAARLAREDLTEVFSHLSSAGKVLLDRTPAFFNDRPLKSQIVSREHWEGVINRLLRDQIRLDESFPAHASDYL